ncbi:hypothetical protein AVEN_253679-1 [Araneus ventricosus]|uniref:Uncharacterized protein n=1 Tax=Araneus ventricosus TaxID=182803 RepID=A0A4Y2J0N7_ARAVE|nr:hypothetical protein AVEN_253679-1 [Araneus ventricosus]
MRKILFFQTYACSFECLSLSLAYANFKGNCYLLNWDGKFFGIIGMRGIKKLSPLAMPVITVSDTMFGPSLVTLTSCFEATNRLFWNGPRDFEPRSDDEDDA